MKVSLSVKAEELKSSSSVQLTLHSCFYNHAVKRLNELAEELKQMNDELSEEASNEL